jgi:peptidoglycan/LPS O-acetylase OafA/YrhL
MQTNHQTVRVFGLDIFRAVAILLVVLAHGKFLLDDTRLEGFPYIKRIDGVDLFFVLSGFLIGSILLKDIHATEKFGLSALTRFWKRRWWRTLPNYYLILLVNYIIVYFGLIREDITQFNWKFLFFLQNFSTPFRGFFWESWSLSVEEWFYISTPIFLCLCLKFLRAKHSFLLTIVVMIILPFLYRIWLLNPTISETGYDLTFRKIVLTRLDSIAYGLLAAWMYYYYRTYWERFKVVSFFIGIGLLIFILNYDSPHTSFYKQAVYLTITPVFAMLLLPLAHSIKTVHGLLPKAITHISQISYAMYLINLALVAEVIRDNFPPTSEMDGFIKYALYWLLVIAGSTALYSFFERPMMNFRDK